MKTFSQFITEAAYMDILIGYIKYVEAYKGTHDPDAAHNEKMMLKMAEIHHVDLEALRKQVLAHWKPGKCPKCHGVGEIEQKPDLFCAGTGLQGMDDAQAKWFIEKREAVEKLEDESHHLGYDWYKKYSHSHLVAETKLAKDIIKAANRVGVKTDNAFDWDDGTEETIYKDEYYQGHEQDWYIGVMSGMLSQIAQKIATKHGWKPMPWTA